MSQGARGPQPLKTSEIYSKPETQRMKTHHVSQEIVLVAAAHKVWFGTIARHSLRVNGPQMKKQNTNKRRMCLQIVPKMVVSLRLYPVWSWTNDQPRTPEIAWCGGNGSNETWRSKARVTEVEIRELENKSPQQPCRHLLGATLSHNLVLVKTGWGQPKC